MAECEILYLPPGVAPDGAQPPGDPGTTGSAGIPSASMNASGPAAEPSTLLLTLSGQDRPGVTSAIFDSLSRAGVEVVDIEQIVLRGRLILGVLVTAPRDVEAAARRRRGHRRGARHEVEVERGTGDNRARRAGRSHVTIIGTPLRAAAFAAVAGRIADSGANIDRIERMARYPVTAIDLHVSGADPDRLRTVLAARGRAAVGIDIAVQPAEPAAARHCA